MEEFKTIIIFSLLVVSIALFIGNVVTSKELEEYTQKINALQMAVSSQQTLIEFLKEERK